MVLAASYLRATQWSWLQILLYRKEPSQCGMRFTRAFGGPKGAKSEDATICFAKKLSGSHASLRSFHLQHQSVLPIGPAQL